MVQTPQIGRKLAKKRAPKRAPIVPSTPMTGAQLVAYWDSEKLGGVYADKGKYPGTAAETARTLREREEARQ